MRASQLNRLGVGRTFQQLSVFPKMSVIDNIKVGRHHLLKKGFLAGGLYWLTGARDEELEHHAAVEEVIDFLEIQAIRNRAAGTLSYGLRKRVELARAVAAKPKLLLLDEPMAGMGAEESEQMAALIAGLRQDCAVLLIEHDVQAVFRLADTVSVLVNGRLIASGEPDVVRSDPGVVAAYLGDQEDA